MSVERARIDQVQSTNEGSNKNIMDDRDLSTLVAQTERKKNKLVLIHF